MTIIAIDESSNWSGLEGNRMGKHSSFEVILYILMSLCVNVACMRLSWAGDVSSKGHERQIALVIGNSAYKDAPLDNPVNDARAIADTLAQLGFTVIKRENATLAETHLAVREFGDELIKGGVGLFYYAGHGMQIDGRNYLIPVDADIARDDEVAFKSIDANQILEKMETAKNKINIVILDACRNNPFARGLRSKQVGLAQMEAPAGSIVAFATSPGAAALDGQGGKHGIYTQHLLDVMVQPHLKIEEVFKIVRARVRKTTIGRQTPWESTSLEGDFYFLPTAGADGLAEWVEDSSEVGSGLEQPRSVASSPTNRSSDDHIREGRTQVESSLPKGFSFSRHEVLAHQQRADRRSEIENRFHTPCSPAAKAIPVFVQIEELRSGNLMPTSSAKEKAISVLFREQLQRAGLKEIHLKPPIENSSVRSSDKKTDPTQLLLSGVASMYGGYNSKVGLNEVSLRLQFSLLGNGEVLSDVEERGSTYAEGDVESAFSRLCHERVAELVSKLYADYCSQASSGGVEKRR